MKELIAQVHNLVNEELERANEANPLFHSKHEGVAVIDEEVDEVLAEIANVVKEFRTLRKAVYKDKPDAAADALEIFAVYLACEAIQVAAMARKFEISKEDKNE